MAEAKEELVVNDRVKELADKIKAGINFNKETAVGTEESNGSLYWAREVCPLKGLCDRASFK